MPNISDITKFTGIPDWEDLLHEIIQAAPRHCTIGKQIPGTSRVYTIAAHKRSQKQITGDFWIRVKVGKTDECWPWLGGTFDIQGFKYGSFCVKMKRLLSHRVSAEFRYGTIPESIHVCHKCDNPVCVNPHHLFLGTHQDNMDDMVRKGRHRTECGTQRKCAKLTEEIVLSLRQRFSNSHVPWSELKEIASSLKVSPTLLVQIRNRRIWKHV